MAYESFVTSARFCDSETSERTNDCWFAEESQWDELPSDTDDEVGEANAPDDGLKQIEDRP